MNSASGSTMLQFPTEILVVVIVALGFISLSLFAPRSSENFFRRFEAAFIKLAERKTRDCLVFLIIVRLALPPCRFPYSRRIQLSANGRHVRAHLPVESDSSQRG
jgi:hypothetical protein